MKRCSILLLLFNLIFLSSCSSDSSEDSSNSNTIDQEIGPAKTFYEDLAAIKGKNGK